MLGRFFRRAADAWRSATRRIALQDDPAGELMVADSAPAGSWMRRAARLRRSPGWTVFVGMSILVNAVVLGVLTAEPESGVLLVVCEALDQATLAVLVLDAALTILVKRSTVFRSGWDMFDVSVTLLSVFPAFQAFSALRAFRTVRLLRLLTFIPNGRATIDGLFAAMRSMVSTIIMICVVFYIFIILCMTLFRPIDPTHFGTFGSTIVSLYEVMVFYGASSEVMRHVTTEMPWSWLVFIPFIFLTSFALMNMFIGVVASAIESEMRKDEAQGNEDIRRLEDKVDTLTARVEELLSRPR